MRSTLIALALSLPTLAFAGPVNLVANGDFEANALNAGQWKVFAAASNSSTGTTTPLQGWTLASGSGIELRNQVAGAAQHGSQFVELDSYGNSSMSQAFDALALGASYELSFWYAPRAGVRQDSNGLQVFWNGQALSAHAIETAGVAADARGWTPYSFDVVAASGINTLTFAAVGPSDSLGGSLDNVSLVQDVPEPASLALSLAGLLGIGALRRRRA